MKKLSVHLAKNHQAMPGSTLVVFSSIAKSSAAKSSKSTVKSPVKLSSMDVKNVLQSAVDDGTITGKSHEACIFRSIHINTYTNVIILGIGSGKLEEKLPEAYRQLGASLHSAVKSLKSKDICVEWDGAGLGKKDFAASTQAFVEGLLLSDYSFDELKSQKKQGEEKTPITMTLVTTQYANPLLKKSLHAAEVLAECVNFSRRLGDLPGNLMTPEILADTVVAAAKGTGIKSEIWDRARIKKEKMGGLYGVAQGSEQEPRFIILRYNGAAKATKPIVFVGKGLTFDTGGISIKPSASMEEMKYDMCGGANVLGGLLAIAKLKLKVNAIALVPATENMPGGAATKPGDVHTARNGKTFEVNNTDAEGRLILSDALCFGSEQKPQMMVDAATLTGAMVVALGNTHTGYFTRSEALNKKIQSAADKSGEWVWRMPLCDHHTKDMKGVFADLSNISSSKGAGSATAAAFLEQFVEEGIPWAHFDIAGTGWAVGNRLPYCSKKGASGVLVRTFVELAREFQ